MYRTLLVSILAAATVAAPVHAQYPSEISTDYLSHAARTELARESRTASGVMRPALHAVFGAVVGAGLGYFTSQVIYSDWDKTSNSTFLNTRRNYSLGGAAIGALTGLIAGPHMVPPGGPIGASTSSAPPKSEVISRAEIDDSGMTTAYEVVRSLHPDWLIVRGNKMFHEGSRAIGDKAATVVVEGTPQIRVYQDVLSLGGVDALRQIVAQDVQAIVFLSPSEATYRFGAGHAHGAIVVQTRGT